MHDIFSIAGRTDAPSCNLAQPNFALQMANHNAIFRIPTPVFGAGLLENVSDEALRTNLDNTALARAALSIAGRFNTNGNDGTITRFGWKAQNKSLLLFAGEAYNVEQGVTNEIFQNDRFPGNTSDATIAACTFNTSPEDGTNIINGQANTIVGGVTKPRNLPRSSLSVRDSSRGRIIVLSRTVNSAEFAPIPSPRIIITKMANPSALSRSRMERRRSGGSAVIHLWTIEMNIR